MPFVRSISDRSVARQLAALLNQHNALESRKNAEGVLSSGVRYVVETHGKHLLGACGAHKQSYSFTEIKHLVVHPQWRGKGIGKFLAKRALALVETPLVYATVRENNSSSLGLFKKLGFEVSTHYNTGEHRVVLLTRANATWEKVPPFRFDFNHASEILNLRSTET